MKLSIVAGNVFDGACCATRIVARGGERTHTRGLTEPERARPAPGTDGPQGQVLCRAVTGAARPMVAAAQHNTWRRCLPPNERCCSQRRGGTLCNCAVLRTAPFTANLLEPLQQNAALGGKPTDRNA